MDTEPTQSIEELVEELYDLVNIPEEKRAETTVDESAEVAHIPNKALRELATHIIMESE